MLPTLAGIEEMHRFLQKSNRNSAEIDGLLSSVFNMAKKKKETRNKESYSVFFEVSLLNKLSLHYRTFAAQRFVRHLCISKAGTFLSIHFSVSDLFQKRPSWKGRAVAGPFFFFSDEAI